MKSPFPGEENPHMWWLGLCRSLSPEILHSLPVPGVPHSRLSSAFSSASPPRVILHPPPGSTMGGMVSQRLSLYK